MKTRKSIPSYIVFGIAVCASVCTADASEKIRLLVRGDDIGSTHAANIACIRTYKEGIVRSVELMVPCAWFPEAVKLLNENPGLDVGVHLTLTSEWEKMKWRPLTRAPSLVDADGYFFPMVWPNTNFPPGTSLKEANWNLKEIETELRAQIGSARRHVPHISHLSAHMAFTVLDRSIADLVRRLAEEYGLETEGLAAGAKPFPHWGRTRSTEERIAKFVAAIEQLQPGTYVFVEHPGLDVPEMQAIGHKGYEDVAADRAAVTQVFVSSQVKNALERKGVELVGYKDLKQARSNASTTR
ncbi:MAG: polysaccharide deacetylase family protein [Verrucomicrobiae bacterium]|nr:polysaccharide deacetylase family protein [Verrucomicrobiae bacterium]